MNNDIFTSVDWVNENWKIRVITFSSFLCGILTHDLRFSQKPWMHVCSTAHYSPLLNHKHTVWLSSCVLFAASPACCHVHEACTETWGGEGEGGRRSGLRCLPPVPWCASPADDLMRRGGGGAQRPVSYLWWIKWGLSSCGDTLEDWENFFWALQYPCHLSGEVRLWKHSWVDRVVEVIQDTLVDRLRKVKISRVLVGVCWKGCRDMPIEQPSNQRGLTALCFMCE